MLTLLCIFCPPLACIAVGKPGAALFNVLLWFLGWVPGTIHAFIMVNEASADKRMMKYAKIQAAMNRKD